MKNNKIVILDEFKKSKNAQIKKNSYKDILKSLTKEDIENIEKILEDGDY